ncbi:hypothetical protein CHISP_3123 [Chitinispirillum alkaliphilum]|nr:hypothetical protein CHISP_3123 [Chitinispirillum alkaliphilum]
MRVPFPKSTLTALLFLLFCLHSQVHSLENSNLSQNYLTLRSESSQEYQRPVVLRRGEFSLFAFGPAYVENIPARTLSYNFLVGRLWEVNPFAGIRVNADFTTDFENSVIGSLNLGLKVIPFPEEISPYAAAEFGFGGGREGSNNFFGFNAAGSLGAILFRTASVQMLLEAKASILFDDIENGFPTVYTARIGILY